MVGITKKVKHQFIRLLYVSKYYKIAFKRAIKQVINKL